MKKEVKNLLVLISCVVVVMLSSAFAMGHEQIIEKKESVIQIENDLTDESMNNIPDENLENIETVDTVPEEPVFEAEDITALVMGQDFVSGLTDVIMVVHFDAENNEIKLISVPRDYYINFREEAFEVIYNQEDVKGMPKDQKITEILFNLTKKSDPLEKLDALYVVKDVVSVIVNMEIDYMAVVNTGGFREIVDIAGGVDFDVPQRMKKSDPLQDLYIDLEAGMQHLDGDKAEQLIRYRDYNMGDLDRIQVQQDFIEALYKQVAERATLNQIIEIATTGYGYLEADFGMALLLEYAKYVFELNPETVLQDDNMITLPFTGFVDINGREAISWNMVKVHQIVDELINGTIEN